MEVLAAMSLVGLMAMAAAKPMRMTVIGAAGARTAASRLSFDLMRCRRMAIKTSAPHALVVQYSGGRADRYQLFRAGQPIGQPTKLPKHAQLDARGRSRRVEFDALGRASHSAQLSLCEGTAKSPALVWKVVVAQATGAISVVHEEK